MNKSGHLAAGVLAGSAYIFYAKPAFLSLEGAAAAALLVAGAAVGSLAPDLDHKTSTASKLISPFSAGTRRTLNSGALLGVFAGVMLYLLQWGWTNGWIEDSFAIFVAGDLARFDAALRSAPVWLAAGLLLAVLSKLRGLILLGAGAIVLYAYAVFDLHWMALFIGFSLLLLPAVKHRGVIHTPEFAAVLTWGAASALENGPWYAVAIVLGLVVGWWSHLVCDTFGVDGIHSLFAPFLRFSLRLFRNGGPMEKLIASACWTASVILWGGWLL